MKEETMTKTIDTSSPIDVWLKFDAQMTADFDPDDDIATHEANTFQNSDGSYRIEWYLNSVGLVKTVEFDTLADAYDWYEREDFQDFSG